MSKNALLIKTLSRFSPYLVIVVLLFFIIPGVFIYQSIAEISYADVDTLLVVSLTLFIIYLFLALLLHGVFSLFSKEKYLVLFAKILMFYVFIAGLLFPVSMSSALIPLNETPIDFTNLTLALICTGIVFFAYRSSYKKMVIQFFYTLLFINFTVAIYGFILLKSSEKDLAADMWQASIFQASSEKNIFVMSFDGVTSDSILRSIKKDGNLRSSFDGFVFYQNVSSSSPASDASIYAELLGNQDFKEKAGTLKEFGSVYRDRLLTNVLRDNGAEVSVYGRYANAFKDTSTAFRQGQLLDEIPPYIASRQAIKIFDISLARVFSRLVFPLTASIKKIMGVKRMIYSYVSSTTQYKRADLYENLSKYSGPLWSMNMSLDVLAFDNYVNKLSVSRVTPTAHFMHYLFSHHPTMVDNNCIFKAHDSQWFESKQGEQGADDLASCALLKMEDFIQKIKKLGIYDSSIIVFKSDHGKPSTYFPSESIKSFRIVEESRMGYSRYMPFLMVKPETSVASAMRVNDSAVLLDDLAGSLCRNSGIIDSCVSYPGVDLFEENLSVPNELPVFYYVVKDSNSNFTYDTHKAIKLNREKDFLNNIHSYFVESFTSKPISCNATLDLTTGEIFHNGLTSNGTWAWWKNKNELLFSINSIGCTKPYVLEVQFSGERGEFILPEITINGKLLRLDEIRSKEKTMGWDIVISKESLMLNRVNVKIITKGEGMGDYKLTRFHPL